MECETRRVDEIAKRFELADVYVFGSRAAEIAAHGAGSETAGPAGSDVDIGVRMRPGRRLTAAERVKLIQTLEDTLRVDRVDLVVLEEADPFLALAVVRGELLYTASRIDQAEYELYVLRRAGDLAPLERERRELILMRGGR